MNAPNNKFNLIQKKNLITIDLKLYIIGPTQWIEFWEILKNEDSFFLFQQVMKKKCISNMFATMCSKMLSKDEVVVSWLKIQFVTMEIKSSMISSKSYTCNL